MAKAGIWPKSSHHVYRNDGVLPCYGRYIHVCVTGKPRLYVLEKGDEWPRLQGSGVRRDDHPTGCFQDGRFDAAQQSVFLLEPVRQLTGKEFCMRLQLECYFWRFRFLKAERKMMLYAHDRKSRKYMVAKRQYLRLLQLDPAAENKTASSCLVIPGKWE